MITLKDELFELMRTKDSLEHEIESLALESHKGSLVDQEGFPRSDVDVHGERIIRNKVARLQNDHKALMASISDKLIELHAHMRKEKEEASQKEQLQPQEQQPAPALPVVETGVENSESAPTPQPPSVTLSSTSLSSSSSSSSSITQQYALNSLDAFFVIDLVYENSPANTAGLKYGDKVLQFGSVLKRNTNPSELGAAMQRVVAAHKDLPVVVTVYRNGEGIKDVQLVPCDWEGRGLLGCRLVPI